MSGTFSGGAHRGPSGKTEGEPPADRSVASEVSVTRESVRDLEKRLKDLLSQPRLLGAGRINMFNLDTLRDRLGERWPTMRERVHAATEKVLSRHLSPRDIHFRTSDDEYIIVFAVVEKQMANLLCGKIVEDLHRLFFGDEDLNVLRVSTAVGTFEGKLIYKTSSLGDILRGIHDSTSSNTDERESATPEASAASSVSDLRVIFRDYHEVDRVNSMYRPVWDVERQVITTYMYTPVRRSPGGSMTEGPAVFELINSSERLTKINVAALVEAVETLDELYRNKFRLMISIPVCFETLAPRKARLEYLVACGNIPDYLRGFIVFELLRFPTGVPNGRMTDLINELRPFCRWTFLRCDLTQPRFSNLVGTGLTGVSVVVPDDREAEARTMEGMNTFVAAAERAGLRTCAVGVASTSLALAARGAGFTFIAGDPVGRIDDIPQHMLRFNWLDLFRNSQRP